MKRTFIALETAVDERFLRAQSILKEKLNDEEMRWVPVPNYHVTLHFIGSTDADSEAKIIAFLSRFAKTKSSFLFRLKGLGCFKHSAEPHVLFVPITDEHKLQQLVADLRRGLAAQGYTIDSQAYRPHLTLARMKRLRDKARFFDILKDMGDEFYQEIGVKRIVFYESISGSGGPVYQAIAQFELNPD